MFNGARGGGGDGGGSGGRCGGSGGVVGGSGAVGGAGGPGHRKVAQSWSRAQSRSLSGPRSSVHLPGARFRMLTPCVRFGRSVLHRARRCARRQFGATRAAQPPKPPQTAVLTLRNLSPLSPHVYVLGVTRRESFNVPPSVAGTDGRESSLKSSSPLSPTSRCSTALSSSSRRLRRL